MRNTATFQRKAYPIAVRCLTSILYFFLFSLSSLAACVDKEPVDEEDADPAKVAGVMQKANLNVQQRIEMQKSLVAQLRQLTEPCTGEGERDPKPEPKQKEEPNSLMAMLNGFFDAEK